LGLDADVVDPELEVPEPDLEPEPELLEPLPELEPVLELVPEAVLLPYPEVELEPAVSWTRLAQAMRVLLG